MLEFEQDDLTTKTTYFQIIPKMGHSNQMQCIMGRVELTMNIQ